MSISTAEYSMHKPIAKRTKNTLTIYWRTYDTFFRVQEFERRRILFIAFEGMDASGKATQSRKLAEKIGAALFSFPDYTTPMGQIIKTNLKQEWKAKCEGFTLSAPPGSSWVSHTAEEYVNAMVFQALQLANRLERAEALRMSVAKGHVVADRYTASAVVYGGADGLNGEYLEDAQAYLPQPDIQILLDIGQDESIIRRPARRDRYEHQSGLMEKVGRLYRELWSQKDSQVEALSKLEPNVRTTRWVVIDGGRDIEEVHQDILRVVDL
jgi:thymidylate kinase